MKHSNNQKENDGEIKQKSRSNRPNTQSRRRPGHGGRSAAGVVAADLAFMLTWIDEASRRRFDCQMSYYHLMTGGRRSGFSAQTLHTLDQLNREMNALDVAAEGCLKKLNEMRGMNIRQERISTKCGDGGI
mgnify:CR=1 FL=1